MPSLGFIPSTQALCLGSWCKGALRAARSVPQGRQSGGLLAESLGVEFLWRLQAITG